MNTQTVETVKTNSAVLNQTPQTPKNTQPAKPVVKAETPKVETKTAEKVVKETPVDERKYIVLTVDGEPMKFRGKQRQIVYDILRESKEKDGLTAADITPLATKAGLVATGGVEPSVKYHLHNMAKDLIVKVTNPQIVIE